MTSQDIVITGVGAIVSNGLSYDEFVESCLSGKSGIKVSKRIDISSLKSHLVGEIDYSKLEEKCPEAYDKTTVLAYCAAAEALEQANIPDGYFEGKNVAIVIGSLFAGFNSTFEIQKAFHDGIELKDVPDKTYENYYSSAIPDFLCKKLGINGPRIIVSNACASGGSAVGLAYDLIKSGVIDMAIAGGTDELNKMCLGGFNSLGAISPKLCAPYVKSSGINIGEGAGMFILEKGDSAEQRNATVHAKILGYYLNSDAYHITTPNPKGEGAQNLMKNVLELNRIPIEDIDFINGHGTGTKANDTAEIRAINQLFKDTDLKIKLTSNKANVGHCMGAAGAVELAATVGSIEKKFVTPLYGKGEKEADHVHVVLKPEKVERPVALSNSFAFGGNNVSLAISSADYDFNSVLYEECPVVITGVDCIGNNHDSFETFEAILADAPVEFYRDSVVEGTYKTQIPEINYKQYMAPDMIRKTDQLTKYAVVTSQRALMDANIEINNDNTNSIGHVYSSAVGPISTIKDINEGIFERGIGKMNPFSFPNSVDNAAPGYITMTSRIKGATITLDAGSSSLMCSLIYARILICSKKAEKVVVTLAEDFEDLYQMGFNNFGVLSNKADINDFSNKENTVILTPGSVSFVLESKESALKRGQKIYAELLGCELVGSNNGEDKALLDPSLDNYYDTLEAGIKKSGLTWSEIDLYCSPSAGVVKNDIREKEQVWDKLPENVDILSVKPYCGFNVSIFSAYNLVAALRAFQKEDAYVVKESALEKKQKIFKTAVVGSYYLGNTVGCVVVKKVD